MGHVEAGLRSGSLRAPFPEEGNRRVIDTLSQILWAPTENAAEQLRREGLGHREIHVTGNTVIDALLQNLERARSTQWPELRFLPSNPSASKRRIVLVTAHRREAFGKPFQELCEGLQRVAEENPDVEIVYPVHLNPQVQGPVHKILGGHPRIHCIEPLGYLAFLNVMDRSDLVITDSGGLQEEAPALNKPVLVMRDRTERQEGLEAGTIELVGTSANAIAKAAHRLLTCQDAYRQMAEAKNPYGDGTAALKIVATIEDYLSKAPLPSA